jgi:hypothetical protein
VKTDANDILRQRGRDGLRQAIDNAPAETIAPAERPAHLNSEESKKLPPGPQPLTPQLEYFDVGNEEGKIPPREWLLGTTFSAKLIGVIEDGE